MYGSVWKAYQKINVLRWVLTGMAEHKHGFQVDDLYRILTMVKEIERELGIALDDSSNVAM